MKIYISADIEGVSGIVHPEQTLLNGKDYGYGRSLMIKEVNATVEGALAGGVDQVIVGDAHGYQFSLLPEELHPRALLATGNIKPFSSMLQGLDESFDGVFFVGYHARSGVRNGVLNHTYFAKEVRTVRLNGLEVGEIGINAALAGYFNVPLLLVSGDQAAIEESRRLLGDITTVTVKTGYGRYSALCRHPGIVRDELKKAAQKALANRSQASVFSLDKPISLEIEFSDSTMADLAALIPHVERLDDRIIRYVDHDYSLIYKFFRAALFLANAAYHKDY